MSFARAPVLVVSAVLLLGLATITNPAIAAAVNNAVPNNPSVGTEHQSHTAASGNDMLTSFNPSDLIHHYTSEELNNNRLMSMGRNGVEYVQTDAEVIRTLEKVQSDPSSSFLTYPHYSVVKEMKEDAKRKRQIIGYDDRYRANYPNCAIGYLSTGCTAFLIGPHHAITAGHCVYNCSTKTWANRNQLDLYIGRDCNTPGRRMTFSRAWTYHRAQHCDPRLHKVDYDIAWILYDSKDRASCWTSFSSVFSSTLRLCGYPSDIYEMYHCLYYSWCTDARKRRGDMAFDNTCDAWPGMSGSPMFAIYSSSTRTFETAIGTFTQYFTDNSGNLGTRITPFRFQWSLDWMCENGYCTSPISRK